MPHFHHRTVTMQVWVTFEAHTRWAHRNSKRYIASTCRVSDGAHVDIGTHIYRLQSVHGTTSTQGTHHQVQQSVHSKTSTQVHKAPAGVCRAPTLYRKYNTQLHTQVPATAGPQAARQPLITQFCCTSGSAHPHLALALTHPAGGHTYALRLHIQWHSGPWAPLEVTAGR